MKNTHFLLTALTLFFASCAADPGERQAYTSADKNAALPSTEPAANFNGTVPMALTDPARKILRTADLRCRVKDAYAAASTLENAVRTVGGVIAESRLEASEISTEEIPHGDDSLKQVRSYITTAHLTLRVPAGSLDSIVRLVPQGALFLHHRALAQEDATLRYFAAEWKAKAADRTPEALAKARRADEVIDVSEYEEDRTGRQLDRRIETLDILDRAAYATLTVEYYQPQSVDVQVVVNPAASVRVPLGNRLLSSLLAGWRGLEGLVVFFVALWPLWLAAGTGWLLYRSLRRRVQSVQVVRAQ